MEGLWDPPAEEPEFQVVWRGYDRRQVDEYLRSLAADPGSAGPPVFDVTLRGYDRHEVEWYIQRFDHRP